MTVANRRTRAYRIMRAISVTVIATLAVSGCVPGGDDESERPELRLYTGDIPAPAPLAAGGFVEMPEMPEPPTDFTDEEALKEYQEQMLEYSEKYANEAVSGVGDHKSFIEDVKSLVENTRNSDAESVAAWQSLLVASGIAVGTGADAVELNGSKGAGIAMTFPELRLFALAGATQSGMALTELAYVLEGLEIFEGQKLAEALYEDLTNALDTEFGTIFLELSPEVFGPMDGSELLPYDKVVLSAAQVSLVLRRLSAEFAEKGYELGGAPTASAPGSTAISTVSHRASLASGALRECEVDLNPWETIGQEQIGKGLGAAFGKAFGYAFGATAGALLGAASLAASLATIMAKMWLMDATFSMSDSPLVRTKTTDKGEQKDVRLKFTLDDTPWQEASECLKHILEPLGIDMPFADAKGAMKGIDVTFKLIDQDRLWLDSSSGDTSTYLAKTDRDGVAEFGLVGQPQESRMPDTAEEHDVTSRIQADANVNNSDFAKQLRSLPWAALGGPFGALPGLLERWKLLSYGWDAQVRDWRAETDFEVTLAGTITAHSGQYLTVLPNGYCGGTTLHRSATTTGTLATTGPEKVTAELLTDGGKQAVLLRPTSLDAPQPDFVNNEHDGFQQFEMMLKYETQKSQSEPGKDPMPDEHTEQGAGCGDGEAGSGAPPNDCGPRSYTAVDWVHNDGDVLHLLHDRWLAEDGWSYCGIGHSPTNPATTPTTLENCPAAEITGQLPPWHEIFDSESTGFEVVGTLDCYRENGGSLHMVDIDWTMTFCRIVEGEPAC